jgi:hypothetical protein
MHRRIEPEQRRQLHQSAATDHGVDQTGTESSDEDEREIDRKIRHACAIVLSIAQA